MEATQHRFTRLDSSTAIPSPDRSGRRLSYGVVVSSLAALAGVVVALTPIAVLAYFQSSSIVAPGVRVGSLLAERMTRQQLASGLDELWNRGRRLAAVDTSDASRAWTLTPEELGLRVDAAATASEAMQVGREPGLLESAGQLFDAARDGWTVTPVVRFDEAAARQGLERLRPLVEVPARDAGLDLQDGRVRVLAASDGKSLDVEATLAFLAADPKAVLLTYGFIPLITRAQLPAIKDASAAASKAAGLIDSGLTIEAYDPVTDEHIRWVPEPGLIASWLRVGSSGSELTVAVDEARLGDYLEERNAALGAGRGLDVAQAERAAQAGLTRQPADVLRVRYEPTQRTAAAGETLQTIGWQVGFPLWKMDEYNPTLTHGLLAAGQVVVMPPKDAMLGLPVIPGKRIIISIGQQRLWAYQDGAVWSEHVISTGIASSPTMAGLFQVESHYLNAYGSRWDLWMPHFLGIYDALPGFTNGIHGLPLLSNGVRLWGNVLGRPASFGCIILDLDAAEKIYNWADDGVVVEIRR
jgi:hypothetical protein